MKTTVFELTGGSFRSFYNTQGAQDRVYTIPTLPAYAILTTSLEYHDPGRFDEFGNGMSPRHSVDNDSVIIHNVSGLPDMNSDGNRLIVHYAGIRDYSLLFPHINNPEKQMRLGQFADEADRAFESSAWMSFVIMSSAVVEGLLSEYFKGKFMALIQQAEAENLISTSEAESLQTVRLVRNQFHTNKYSGAFADRTLAMDVFTLYDRLLKRHWI